MESEEIENNPPTEGHESTAHPDADIHPNLSVDESAAEPPAENGNDSVNDGENQIPPESESREYESDDRKDDDDKSVVISPNETLVELAEGHSANEVRLPVNHTHKRPLRSLFQF